ncbi:MAG: bifunctional metallophosphatase/5'-nucleotidase [Candidatus Freyarchaeota archaeon]
MKSIKITALVCTTIFLLGLTAPVIASAPSSLNSSVLLTANSLGTQNTGQPKAQQKLFHNLTILFHSDLHSELLPWPLADYVPGKGNDPTVGGMARVATKINEIRTAKSAVGEPVLTFMDGDFLMGTPFEWVGGQDASVELLLMSADYLDYTAVGLGNHEFDYSDHGLSLILNNTNTTLGGKMPVILCSNLDMSNDAYNLKEFITRNLTITTLNGVKIGIFSLIGYNANSTMFFKGSYNILDPVAVAQEEVNYFKNKVEGVDLIICLSHSGWKEDVALARKVDGIDIILGGHDHILLTSPVIVNTPSGNTTIVDAKCYAEYLGELEVTVKTDDKPGQGVHVRAYNPIHITDAIEEDPIMSALIDGYASALNTILSGMLGKPVQLNQTIAFTEYNITGEYGASGETAIGDLVADAIRWQANNVSDSDAWVDFAFVPSGVIRHGIYTHSGNISFYDAVSVVPLGGVPYQGPYLGWLLCTFYLYGYEIKNAMEFSVYMGGDYFEQVSGLKLTYTPLGAPGSQVISIEQDANGTYVPLNSSKLYRVCVNLEAALLLPEIGQMYTMFQMIPRFSNGTPIPMTNSTEYVMNVLLLQTPGDINTAIPEWLALVNYLSIAQSGTVDPAYNSTQGRISVWQLDPMSMFTLYGLGQFVVSQQSSSSLMLGGLAGILLIVIVAAAVFLTRKT